MSILSTIGNFVTGLKPSVATLTPQNKARAELLASKKNIRLAPQQTGNFFSDLVGGLPNATGTVAKRAGNFFEDLLPGIRATRQSIQQKSTTPIKEHLKEVVKQPEPRVSLKDGKLAIRPMSKEEFQKEASFALGFVGELQAIKGVVGKTTQVGIDSLVPKQRGFVTTVKEASITPPEVAMRVQGVYVPRSTDKLAQEARNVIKANIDEAHRLVSTQTDENAVATASELIKHYSDLGGKAATQAEKNVFFDKAADVANEIAPKLTELGRAVQAASIYERLSPESIVRTGAKVIEKFNETARTKIPLLTGEQAGKLVERAKKIQGLEGTAKAKEFQKLQDELGKLVPSSLYQKIIVLWKAGLLTGMKTSGLNIASNIAHGGLEVAKDIPTVAVDSVASIFTGKRAIGLTTKGWLKGTVEGFKKGFDYLKTGFDERNVGAKLDWKKVNFGTGKVARGLQKYEESIFRVLGAEDQPFYYGAKARSLQSQAIAEAKNLGLKGKGAVDFIDNFVKSPSDEALRYAVNDAEVSVFQNQTALGTAAKAIQRIPYVGEVVVPFGRTPAAVATQLINYSPLGVVKTIADQIRKGHFDQRTFSQGIGRSITGTGIMFLGRELFKKGMIELGIPKTETERKQWELEGKSPNSILMDGKWRSLQVLGPAGNLLIVGGYYVKGLEESGSPTKAISIAMAGAAKSVTDQTFLKGLSGFLNAVNDPARYAESFVENTLGSLVPTVVADIARATDPKERTREGVVDVIKSRIPSLRESLDPRQDVFGQDIKRIGNFLEVMADPTRPSPAKGDVVVRELRDLMDAGESVTPTAVKDKLNFQGHSVPLSEEQRYKLQKGVGQGTYIVFKAFIEFSGYKNLTLEMKVKLLDMAHEKVWEKLKLQILTKEQLGDLLLEMSESERKSFIKEQKSNF